MSAAVITQSTSPRPNRVVAKVARQDGEALGYVIQRGSDKFAAGGARFEAHRHIDEPGVDIYRRRTFRSVATATAWIARTA